MQFTVVMPIHLVRFSVFFCANFFINKLNPWSNTCKSDAVVWGSIYLLMSLSYVLIITRLLYPIDASFWGLETKLWKDILFKVHVQTLMVYNNRFTEI